MNVQDLIITSLETITAYNPSTGNFRWILDELQDATIQNSQETTDVTGKNGRRLATLKRNKAVTISGTNGMISGGLLETQTGGTTENKSTTVEWHDYLTVSDNKATTTYKATGTAGAEITGLFVRASDGTLGEELTQDSTAASGKFAYAPATKELTFSGLADNTEIFVTYKRTITADVLENSSDTYSETVTLYVDALAEDRCNNVYRVQFYVPKADFSGEFSIEMGDNQTTHGFEANSLANTCFGSSATLWTYTVFGVDTADAA